MGDGGRGRERAKETDKEREEEWSDGRNTARGLDDMGGSARLKTSQGER